MKLVLMLALCALATSATAQSVYRCRDAAGAVVYQSAACSGKTEKTWMADPGLATTASAERQAAERSIARDRQYLQASNRPKPVRTPRLASRASTRALSPCERERQARHAAHERTGVRWSYREASYWDARVFKVCR
ncbi:protein of unknown function [Pseudoxanthomonas sp. GM95]|uniref:DUF4124 domain-containing protein n=1 Tax=Pseudoxanthomonas sp. GM95 TaxID=1881043 RepID=UPI0008CAFE66|nr:DUF4124 domain-containing protein [Pseudoxanthomonas sp. GM95]SEL07417.1 protein of unknown function [Pseudoxanthomonas sp. GM95]